MAGECAQWMMSAQPVRHLTPTHSRLNFRLAPADTSAVMPWSATYSPDLDAVETRYAGRLTPADLDAAIRGTIDLGAQHATHRFLADVRDLEGGHSIVDLYEWIEKLSRDVAGRRMKEAVLVAPQPAGTEFPRFWETAATNRGLNVRLFDDEAAAREWLRG